MVMEKGVFSVLLGSVTSLSLGFDEPYYLEIKVGNEVMSPRQRIASVGYAFRAKEADSAIRVEEAKVKATSTDSSPGYLDSKIDSSVLGITNNQLTVKDASISQAKLKTAVGEVSNSAADRDVHLILPGGEYGFYPQLKCGSSDTRFRLAVMGYGEYGGGVIGAHRPGFTSYSTRIYTRVSGDTIYVRQRYITSSGQDHWIFLLTDKNTENIISAWEAPDHPAYGNGGNYNQLAHPFSSYDSAKHKIILLDKNTALQLKQEAKTTGNSILTLINQDYGVDFSQLKEYQPLHSGKYLTQDGEQVMEMVETVPWYIEVRGLKELTPEEKLNRELSREQQELQRQEAEQEKQNKLNALQAKLGLSDEEFQLLGESLK